MRTILLLLSLSSLLSANAQVEPDPEKAFREARQSGRQILLVFSGSDWCMPCIRFEKNILTDSAFREFAGKRIVILEADFPQRKKIPTPMRSQYEALAGEFNTEGAFPKIVLLTPDRKLLAILPYTGQSPADFIGEVKKSLNP
jgi:thiamine biosynthesis lipoprotein